MNITQISQKKVRLDLDLNMGEICSEIAPNINICDLKLTQIRYEINVLAMGGTLNIR